MWPYVQVPSIAGRFNFGMFATLPDRPFYKHSVGVTMGRRDQNILETPGNTPVVRINRLAPPSVNLLAKVEAFNPLGSVKDRLALGVIEAPRNPVS
jgi:hypothetical protein